MPSIQVWIKKTILGPQGPIELGLGGTHEVNCEAHQVPAERRALFLSYEQEVNRLLEHLRQGQSVDAHQPPLRQTERVDARVTSRAEGRAPANPEKVSALTRGDDGASKAKNADSGQTASPGYEEDPAARAEAEAISLERSRMFLAELQERLAHKGRQKLAASVHSEDTTLPPIGGQLSLDALNPVPHPEPHGTHPAQADEEDPPESLAHLLLPREGI